MSSVTIEPPVDGRRVTVRNGKIDVPDYPIIPFIEGDGTGPDIWRASVRVLDAAVARAYRGARQIKWMEVYAGEKAYTQFNSWLPDETVDAFREFLVGEGGKTRSLCYARDIKRLAHAIQDINYILVRISPA